MEYLFKHLKNALRCAGKILGWLSTTVFLTLIFVALGIVAIILKLFRKDLLDRKIGDRESYWRIKENITHSIEQAKHQF